MLPTLQRAWQLYRFRRYPLALEETVKFLGQYPESAEAFCLAALIHGKEKRQKQALEAAEAAIRYMPDWSYPHYVHALVSYWFNKYDVALKSLSEALRIQPTDPDFYELVSAIHAENGHLHTSLEMADKGLEHHPEHVGCLFRRGACLFDLNRRAEADVVFRTILTIENEHAPSQGFVGYFEVQQSNYADALPLLRNALRDNPEWKLAQSAWKESLRGQYAMYGRVARLKQWIFEWHLWRSFFLILLATSFVLSAILYRQLNSLFDLIFSVGPMALLATLGVLVLLFVMLHGYLAIMSTMVMLFDRELRHSSSPEPKHTRIEQGNPFSWYITFIIMALIVLIHLIRRH